MIRARIKSPVLKYLSTTVGFKRFCSINQFETVFKLPSIKYISILNRLKVYHLYGACAIVPSCGAMEIANIIPEYSFLTASYIGLTGAVTLTLATLPFLNTIGFIYISDDNRLIKVSSVDFWGKRKDRIVKVDDWIPLLNKTPKLTDAIYLTPELSDGTKYKLFVKFGNVLNSQKMSNLLE